MSSKCDVCGRNTSVEEVGGKYTFIGHICPKCVTDGWDINDECDHYYRTEVEVNREEKRVIVYSIG